MKKFSIFAVIFMLMLFSAQSVFAKNYVGLNVGYGNLNMSGELIDVLKTELHDLNDINLETKTNSLVINLNGGYDVTPKFSLVGSASTYISFKDTTFIVPQEDEIGNLNYFNLVKSIFDINLYARYQVFGFDKGNIGLQAGMSLNNANIKFTQNTGDTLESYFEGFKINGLFLNVGAYADFAINDKLNFYADAKFAVATKYSVYVPKNIQGIEILSDFSLHTAPKLVNSFFTNITAGLGYKVSPHVVLGIEWNATNMSILGAAQSVLTWLNESEIIFEEDEPQIQVNSLESENTIEFPQDAKLWTNTIGISVRYVF